MSGLIYYSDERRVLPKIERIEDYDDSKPDIPGISHEERSIVWKTNLENEIKNWKDAPTLHKAGEILSDAIISDQQDKIKEVVDFILKEDPDNSVLQNILNNNPEEFKLNSRISENRKLLNIEPKDAITWTDQAINYLELGKREKSLKSIETALAINPDNGFIVRNASRIFSLLGDNGRSIQVLKRSEYYKYDPQILSAEISFSQLEERHTKGIDYGMKLISKNDFTDHQFTELSSAIGTNHHFKGDKKGAEKYFDLALKEPNSNSFAQLLWYKEDSIPEEKFIPYQNLGEIQTHRYTKISDFENAYKYSQKWIDEESFSIRPYDLSAYIAGTMLNNYEKAFEILSTGISKQHSLKSKIDDREMDGYSNDLAYYLLRANKIEEATRYLEKLTKSVKINGVGHELSNVIRATLGLYFYRIGDNELGKSLYRDAIKYFAHKKQLYNIRSAYLNLFCEELRVSNDIEELSKLKKEVDTIVSPGPENDLQHFKRMLDIRFQEKTKHLRTL